MASPLHPSYDPELASALAAMSFAPTVTVDMIGKVREKSAPTRDQALGGRAVVHEERTVVGPTSEIIISIIRSMTGQTLGETYPGIFYTHGGGMVARTGS